MALSGLDIYKLLPKTNCKKCGFQTCLAFAMQLAKKAVSLDKCPFVTSDVRSILEEASQPAIRLVAIGAGAASFSIGNETVLFRHEEKFHHPTALGFILEDNLSDEEIRQACGEILALSYERVGQKIAVELVALRQVSDDAARFAACVALIKKHASLSLVLMPKTSMALSAALKVCVSDRPLVYCVDLSLADEVVAMCKENHLPLAVRARSADEFSQLTKKLSQAGLNDFVLDVAPGSVAQRIWQLTQLRRLAIKKGARSLGFPTMAVVDAADASVAVTEACAYMAKYASIVLMRSRKAEHVLPLLTLRQNIFTDPQKPLQVEPKVYPVGAAHKNSPVLITTNFSLTYYTVLGEIESSRVPSHLICVDTEGMSVLTAWAADKFGPERIADTLVKFKLDEIVSHKNLVIPGYVSVISGDLEEQSGWNILVGPREAAGLPSFLKSLKG
jgi:acetyl-CoA decarbonylase/synthase complex subunit gamma